MHGRSNYVALQTVKDWMPQLASCVQQENDTSQTSSGATHRTEAFGFGRRLNGHDS